MSTHATEGQGQAPAEGQGSQGQASGNQNGNQGQAPGADGGSDQGQGSQGSGIDLSSIQDESLRTTLQAALDKAATETKEARDEAARYRTGLRDAQSKVTEYERANETAEQRSQREAQEHQERLARLETENRDLRTAGTVRELAQAAKAFNPATVHTMIRDRITYDSDGKPTNVAQLLTDLRASDPYLFRRDNNDAGAGGDGGEGGAALSMNDQLRRAAGKM